MPANATRFTGPSALRSRPAIRRWPRVWSLVAAWLLAGLGVAVAQDAPRPLGSLLPDTTIVAFHINPSASGHDFIETLAADLDIGAAADTVAKLARLIGDELDEDLLGLFDSGMHGLLGGSFDEMAEELGADCPALSGTFTDETVHALMGPTVLAVSMSRFNPMPGSSHGRQPLRRAGGVLRRRRLAQAGWCRPSPLRRR